MALSFSDDRTVETPMNRSPIGRAPNYTNAALIMGGLNLFCALFAVWAIWGWIAVALLAVGTNWMIDRLNSESR